MNPPSTTTPIAAPGATDLKDVGERSRAPSATSIPLVMGPILVSSGAQPVAVGVPFPRGVLREEGAAWLRDPTGAPAPLQTSALARWSDRSVKWLLAEFLLDPTRDGRDPWTLRWARVEPSPGTCAGARLAVREDGRAIVVDTGKAVFRLDRDNADAFARVELDGQPTPAPTPLQALLTDAKGRVVRPTIEGLAIEARGPVRATVRIDGYYGGGRHGRCRLIGRISLFAGLSIARVELTLHNPRRARHRGGLWDLGDPGSLFFRDFSLRLGLDEAGPRRIRWIEEPDGPERTAEAGAGDFEIYQDSSGGENWRSRNHVNRFEQVPCRFRGYRVRRDAESSSGLRASPIVSVEAPAATITAAIPEFWQQFPKAIDCSGLALHLRLFPGQFGDRFELQGGEQKTHAAWIHFGRDDRSAVDAMRWVHRPARADARRGGTPVPERSRTSPRPRATPGIVASRSWPRLWRAPAASTPAARSSMSTAGGITARSMPITRGRTTGASRPSSRTTTISTTCSTGC